MRKYKWTLAYFVVVALWLGYGFIPDTNPLVDWKYSVSVWLIVGLTLIMIAGYWAENRVRAWSEKRSAKLLN